MRAYLTERGLSEEISREFRLGLSRGTGLVAKAREGGFTVDEIRAAGLANARGNDYFPFRLMFPLADARGRIVGFQARKLRDDDPLRGKYVNTPESDLFKKGNVLYGLHLARPAVAKQDRAIVVEGNTDVIALRQAGVEPVVASMGTALTEHQVRELGRLTKRLYLCFDADAAGQEATLRGMQLAVGQGFDVRVVALPKGRIPRTRQTRSPLASGTPRATSITACGSRSRRRTTGRRRSCGRARSLHRRRTHPSGRRRFACSPTGSRSRPRRSQGWRRAAGRRPVGRGAARRPRRRDSSRPGGNANVTCSRRSSPTPRCSRSSPR